jgi:hypothetical protein
MRPLMCLRPRKRPAARQAICSDLPITKLFQFHMSSLFCSKWRASRIAPPLSEQHERRHPARTIAALRAKYLVSTEDMTIDQRSA